MPARRILKPMLRIAVILLVGYLALVALIYFRQRSLLYFPSHIKLSSGLNPWLDDGQIIGYCREAPRPRAIWLMMHGNAGQAANRDYVLPRMSDEDSLYVLEYPGYGLRAGSPSLRSINAAATEAYQLLRARNPHTPVCVLGESIGSGPACALAGQNPPPDKIVLVVPFDVLARVAAEHFRFLPVRLLLHDNWDNVESLSHYAGPVDIYGALEDTIIPIQHARNLAKAVPQAQFIPIFGGHNDWSDNSQVKIRR
jgi:pimeloyl-ACP methyl ester carboxylesterase